MELEILARRVNTATGLAHNENLFVLRRYIKVTSDIDLLVQVEKIYDYNILRTLWEAGLNVRMQEAVLKQLGGHKL